MDAESPQPPELEDQPPHDEVLMDASVEPPKPGVDAEAPTIDAREGRSMG